MSDNEISEIFRSEQISTAMAARGCSPFFLLSNLAAEDMPLACATCASAREPSIESQQPYKQTLVRSNVDDALVAGLAQRQ